MVLFGTLVNGVFIIIGSCIGLIFQNIPERIKKTALQGIGLVVALIGLQMALQADNIVLILLSILIGSIIGTVIYLEDHLNLLGEKLERSVSKAEKGNIAEGFVTASLIFVVGAMSIVGALDGGLRGDHEVLVTKAFLDGFMAMVLTSTLGYGVMFSVIPVVLYQGAIALLAVEINNWLPADYLELFINEMTATGGLLILAIGLNILNITKIKVGDFLPTIAVFILFFSIYHLLS
ncbi:DUF554 domain-containing protein [Gracilibacillus sp. YIM 98692]|uniref:DUF554 domain-containing protein n=1 Tax=Gracilibacillus sp. YIM 98692 TaxID=2663532 RepID=UPI0013D0E7D8|nr:DUF554 domain-containing protein [Gracilibacillus sp. YIM 98692]